jgi:hypothetical protein
MASYEELYSLWNESGLRNKVIVAVIVAAESIQGEDPVTPNHANRLLWAKTSLESPVPVASAMFRLVIAANKDATKEAILNAIDASIQSAIDSAVDMFATGG